MKSTSMAVYSLLALLALAATDANGPTLQQRHAQIRRAVEAAEWHQAEKALLELRRAMPAAFTANNYDYLLGRVRHKQGKLDAARQEYASVVERKALLSDYALWHLAEIARSSGQPEAHRHYLETLIRSYPTSLLAEPSRWRLADSFLASKDYAKALAIYNELAKGQGPQARKAQLRIGQTEFEAGRLAAARVALNALLSSRTRDDYALAAVRLLDELDSRANATPDVTTRLRRARIYQFNRDYDQARRHFLAIVNEAPTHPSVPEVLYEIGRGYYQQELFEQAIEWYERVYKQFPKTKYGEQGFYQAGHAHARMQRWSQAVERYEAYLAAYPKGETVTGAHLNAIDALRSAGQAQEALAWCQRTMERFPGELAATTALFSQARIHLAQQQYEAALADFDALLKHNLNRPGPRAPNRPEVTFMRGYCLEQLGRYSDAVAVYLSLPDERDHYYGHRATARLRELARHPQAGALMRARVKMLRQRVQSEQAAGRYQQAFDAALEAWRLCRDDDEQKHWIEQLRQLVVRLPDARSWVNLQVMNMARPIRSEAITVERSARALASELLFLGLPDEGAPELSASFGPNRAQLSSSQLYTLAVYLLQGGYPAEALDIGEIYLAPLIQQRIQPRLLPARLAQTLYPVAYKDLLQRYASERKLDPRFVLSVIRQESRFRVEAKSIAAARGLLQLIPSTAERLAQEAGRRNFQLEQLYEPEIAIELGVRHLDELRRQFSNNWPAVAAAYNAGAESVQRWLARAQHPDPDRFVIEIAFQETKDYVYRVMSNYNAYQQIVSERLK
ncbi:MAG: tetratricopeptide repeat protein [Acidobacteriota bacterium]|nr:tetratricopeptide repeat protein [Acidobacteriota bacterium]